VHMVCVSVRTCNIDLENDEDKVSLFLHVLVKLMFSRIPLKCFDMSAVKSIHCCSLE
jgi:hypothetical protein